MNNKQKISIALNLIAVISQLGASAVCIINRGWFAFQYYTMDSNIFSAITSILLIMSLFTKKSVSQRIHNFRFYSTCCVTVTFVVVVVILVPLNGWHTLPNRLFMGTDLWLHSVGPLLNVFSFVLFEKNADLDKKQPILALIPTLLYAIFALVLNLFRIIEGPYPFLEVYEQGAFNTIIWFLLIGIMVFLISLILKKLNSVKKNQKK